MKVRARGLEVETGPPMCEFDSVIGDQGIDLDISHKSNSMEAQLPAPAE
jgi:hypothetical protein